MVSNALRSSTLILLRDDLDDELGPQVLLLKRSAQSRSLPGVFVFPGGLEEMGDEEIIESLYFQKEFLFDLRSFFLQRY